MVSRKTLKNVGPSHSRYVPIMYKGRAPASELVLLRGGLSSEIALQGGSLKSKIVYRGLGADFENILISGKIRSGSQNPRPVGS